MFTQEELNLLSLMVLVFLIGMFFRVWLAPLKDSHEEDSLEEEPHREESLNHPVEWDGVTMDTNLAPVNSEEEVPEELQGVKTLEDLHRIKADRDE